MSACVVDQDPPRKLRCDSKEMSPALPVDRPLLDKLQVSFMNQSRRLKGVVDSLFTHVTSGQLAQFAVHDRDELRGRAIVSAVRADSNNVTSSPSLISGGDILPLKSQFRVKKP